ncbi:MAG: hypothetical protein J1F39_05230 [Clostridiales bacterium]|nr:hypothetical protein [Clostridiales bacterium]
MSGDPVKDPDAKDKDNEGEGVPPESQKTATEAKVDTGNNKPKKKKVKYIDDGHTVYSMEGLDEARGIKRRDDSIKLTRKEKWAAIRAAFARFLPIFLGVVACFSLTALLLYFWLKG